MNWIEKISNLEIQKILFFRFVPPLDPKKPTDISMGFDNFEILKIDDKDFTVEVNVYLIVKWKDSRIIINFAEVKLSKRKTCFTV